MTLSRWRRIATGLAAGIIVLCAALLGATFRDDGNSVSIASETRVATSVPVDDEAPSDGTGADPTDPVRVIDVEDLPDEDGNEGDRDGQAAPSDTANDANGDDADADDADADDTAGATDAQADPADDANDPPDPDPAGDAASDGAASTDGSDASDNTTAAPPAPLTSNTDALGTGGGVDDAECALDRLVVYGSARVSGVGGLLRDAIVQSGFGAECPKPVAVLASNCPLQFSGILAPDSGYNPQLSFVASSANVDRETLSAVLGELGYTGAEIDILSFRFAEPATPDETWMAVFVPPSFSGWQALAERVGIAPTEQSLCAASGQLAG